MQFGRAGLYSMLWEKKRYNSSCAATFGKQEPPDVLCSILHSFLQNITLLGTSQAYTIPCTGFPTPRASVMYASVNAVWTGSLPGSVIPSKEQTPRRGWGLLSSVHESSLTAVHKWRHWKDICHFTSIFSVSLIT